MGSAKSKAASKKVSAPAAAIKAAPKKGTASGITGKPSVSLEEHQRVARAYEEGMGVLQKELNTLKVAHAETIEQKDELMRQMQQALDQATLEKQTAIKEKEQLTAENNAALAQLDEAVKTLNQEVADQKAKQETLVQQKQISENLRAVVDIAHREKVAELEEKKCDLHSLKEEKQKIEVALKRAKIKVAKSAKDVSHVATVGWKFFIRRWEWLLPVVGCIVLAIVLAATFLRLSNIRQSVATEKAANVQLQKDNTDLKQQFSIDTLHAGNQAALQGWDEAQGSNVKKNFDRQTALQNTKKKLDEIAKKFPADSVPRNDSLRALANDILRD